MTTTTRQSSWSERLLAGRDTAGFLREGQRLALGIGLASLFGLAVGLRLGGPDIVVHASGVALGMIGVCGLAVPTLAILLALANSTVDPLDLARATSRAAAHAGLLLAGLAPGAALFAVTVEDLITVKIVAASGLALAGVLAMRSFVRELAPQISRQENGILSKISLPAFLLFAAVLGARIWWVTIPLLTRGGS